MAIFRAPPGPLYADTRVPGDKSLSHRALILAALARGESRIVGLAPGADVLSTRRALQMLGVVPRGEVTQSPGAAGWRAPAGPIDAGNSATTLRLLAGALAARPFRSTLVGDPSLMRRPMARLVGPLGALGARVEMAPDGRPPVTVGGSALHGADVAVPMASAQVRTAVALAALQAEGPTTITSPPGFRDHTERWLESLGLGHRLSDVAFAVVPGPVPAATYDLPGDLSSAAYFLTAAALRPGSKVTVRRVTLNPGRTGFLEILAAAGARVGCRRTGLVHGDPVGDVTVEGDALRPVRVDGSLAVRALDELPLVGLLGAAARGVSVVSGASELRAKETDRAAAVVRLLRSLGGQAEEQADGFMVTGGGGLAGGVADPAGDHRIALAAAVAAVLAPEGVEVLGFDAADVSWPGFAATWEALWS